MSTPALRFQVVTAGGEVLIDELVGIDDDVEAAATRHADTINQAAERGVHASLVVSDPDGDLTPVDMLAGFLDGLAAGPD